MLRNESVMKAQRRYKKTLAPPSYTYTNTALAKPKHMMDSAHTSKTSATPSDTNTTLPLHMLIQYFHTSTRLKIVIGGDCNSDTRDTECKKQKAKETQSKAQLQPWNSAGR
jgi:hypothetical protein